MKTRKTLERVELLRTTVSRICGSRGMKRIKVKSAQPMRACERISPRM
jgi:hypothetical protein